MKNKFLNLLFLFCCLGFTLSLAHAEDFGEASRYDYSVFDQTTIDETPSVNNYSSACAKYTDKNEKINCCNQATTEGARLACKQSLYQVCMNEKSPKLRASCCEANFSGEDLENCQAIAVDYCDVTEQVRLSKAASAIKVEYEPVVLKADGYDDPNSSNYSLLIYALDIKVYNLTDELNVVVTTDDGNSYSISDMQTNSDGAVVLRDDNVGQIKNYKFVVYSNTGSCESEPLRNIELSTPKYNQLSNREACRQAPHYYKCQEYVSYDFEVGNYVKDVEEYKEKLAKQGIKDAENDNAANKGVITKTIKKVSDNKWIVLGIVIIIGVIISVIILRKRRED